MSRSNKIISIFLTPIFLCGSFFAFGNFISANNGEVNHIVINEILFDASGADGGKEFIELYNKSNSQIDLAGWSLKYFNENSDSATSLVSFGIEDQVLVPAGEFLLIGFNNYEKENYNNVSADIKRTAALPNGKTQDGSSQMITIILFDGENNEIDRMSYDKNSITSEGQSLERDGDSFKIQENPNPQNSNVVNESSQDISVDNNNGDEIPPAPFAEEGDSDEQDGSTALRDNGANDIIPKIIITEFLPDPEDSDRDNEFVEIYNNGDVEVDLSGWILEDKMGSIKKFVISDGVEISVGKYKAFYSDETGIALNNSGDGVILRDNKGDFVDETQISGAALEEQAFALDENKDWVWTLRPTPERENIIKVEEKIILDSESSEDLVDEDNNDDEQDGFTTLQDNGASSYDFSDRIIISEIYPNSEGRDNRNGSYEWIELYNDSDCEVNLNGWMIDDILEKGSKAYIIGNEIIKAGSYKIFDAAYTKIALNNTGDEVNLLWPDGVVVDKIKYEKADEGLSYNLANSGDWFWSSLITPEEENRSLNFSGSSIAEYNAQDYLDDEYFEDEEFGDNYEDGESLNLDYIEASLKDIEYFTKHTRVKVSGIVSTPPGIFSDQTFYISGSGIQVYSYEAKIPDLNVGDEVEIIGEISEIGGEKRILINKSGDIKIISNDNLVKPKIISTGDINEAVEGYLMTVEGRVSQIKSDVFFLDDGSGEIKIYLKPQARIKRPEIEIGDWMVITGQVSQTSAGYRILPRFQGDLRLSRVTGAAQAANISTIQENVENNKEENKSGNFIFYGIIMIVGILILVDWMKIKIIKRRKNNN